MTEVTPVQIPKNIHTTHVPQHLTESDQSEGEILTSDPCGPIEEGRVKHLCQLANLLTLNTRGLQ